MDDILNLVVCYFFGGSTMKELRVAAYARVSTDKEDQSNSLASQRSYFADYINNHDGWKLTEVYYDEGKSGTQTRKRDGFNRMIDDALSNEFDLILTKEVCRFARNTVDTLSFTRKLKDAGVGVIFTIDNIDTRDADGELRLTIMASLAQEESRKTSERVRWGQSRQMEKGVVFGRDLLGYTVDKGIISINEAEVPVVKAIFNKYTNEGKGTHIIARELLEEGLKPMKIKSWSNVVILRALKNEKYVGDLCQKKTYTPNYLTHGKKYNRGAEEMIYIKDHHEGIIDRELWNRTQEELKRRSPSDEQKSKHSNRYWCSGKIYCAECGNRYVSRTKHLKNGTIYKAWRCLAAARNGALKYDTDGKYVGCDNTSINDKTFQICMKYCINLVQGSKDEIKREILREIAQLKKIDTKKTDTAKIVKKIDALELKKRKALDAMLDGLITKDDLKKQTDWYNDDLRNLNHQLETATRQTKEKTKEADTMEKYIKALDEIMSLDSENNLLYKEVLERIVVHKGNVLDYYLKCIPFAIRLEIKTSGKMDLFKVDIIEVSYIDK